MTFTEHERQSKSTILVLPAQRDEGLENEMIGKIRTMINAWTEFLP